MGRLLFAAIVVAGGSFASADISYRATLIRPEDGRSLHVFGLNDYGAVTGSGLFNPDNNAAHMFLWTSEAGFSDLGVHSSCVGFCQSEGWDINNRGDIVGIGEASDFLSLMYWAPGSSLTALRWLYVCGVINDEGWIAGQWMGNIDYGAAALWRPGIGYTILGDLPGGERYAFPTAINNAGVVCGHGNDSDRVMRAFIWDAANGLRPMPTMPNGARAGTATGLNNLGQIVGGCYESVPFGYLWDPHAGYTRLEFGPDFHRLEPRAINDRTEIIGSGYTGTSFFPWVFDPRHGYRYLNEHIDPCVGPINRLIAYDINNVGQILCYSREGTMGSEFGYLLTPYVEGDLNEDDAVDLSDLVILLSNFGRSGDADYSAGDLDCDADVDLQDLATQLSGFGERYP